MTDENYEKAWNRLREIYEDDYMQVQIFMRKLHNAPRIEKVTSVNIRNLVDLVHRCVHGRFRFSAMHTMQRGTSGL